MRVEDARRRVELVRKLAADVERAHVEEDKLHVDVLRAIANGETGNHTRALAEIALETLDIEFPRYCA